MGLPTTLKDFTQKLLPHFYVGPHRYRGIIRPLDIFATGKMRFAKKIGNQLPVLVADNSMRLTTRIPKLSIDLPVDSLVNWMEFGSFVSIAGREIAQVLDWDTEEKTIRIDTPTKVVHFVRDQVFLYSVPIEVVGTYTKGGEVIIVKSPHPLVLGDSILIDETAGNRSFIEHRVTRVGLQEDSDADGNYTWQLYLDRSLIRTIEDNEYIQLRAYPAYQSRLIKIPTVLPDAQLPSGIGPFVVDWLSGPLVTDRTYEEVVEFQGRTITGDTSSFDSVSIDKNHLVIQVPIESSSMLFWDIGLGKVNYGRKYFPPDSSLATVTGIGNPDGIVTGTLGAIYRDLVSGVMFECISDPVGTKWKKMPILHTRPMLIAEPYSEEGTFKDKWFLSQDCIPPITPPEGKAAIGSLKCIPTSELLNGDYFQLDDGWGVSLTFEYKVDGAYVPTPGAITIDVSVGLTADEVAILTKIAIETSGLGFIVQQSSAIVILTNINTGLAGNQVIIDGVTNVNFKVYGMTAGEDGGIKWYIKLYPEEKAWIRVRLYPNDWQAEGATWKYVTDGINGETLEVTLNANDHPVERIDIAVKTLNSSRLWIGDWQLRGSRVASTTYTMLARVMDEYTFATSFLFVKPYFPLLDYLRAWHDVSSYDHGLLAL